MWQQIKPSSQFQLTELQHWQTWPCRFFSQSKGTSRGRSVTEPRDWATSADSIKLSTATPQSSWGSSPALQMSPGSGKEPPFSSWNSCSGSAWSRSLFSQTHCKKELTEPSKRREMTPLGEKNLYNKKHGRVFSIWIERNLEDILGYTLNMSDQEAQIHLPRSKNLVFQLI